MKMNLLISLSLSLALLGSTSAIRAETAADLESHCKNDTTILFCMGYIRGVLEGFQLRSVLSSEKPFICPPKEGIDGNEAVRIVLKFIELNPDNLHKDAHVVIMKAFINSFYCKL